MNNMEPHMIKGELHRVKRIRELETEILKSFIHYGDPRWQQSLLDLVAAAQFEGAMNERYKYELLSYELSPTKEDSNEIKHLDY